MLEHFCCCYMTAFAIKNVLPSGGTICSQEEAAENSINQLLLTVHSLTITSLSKIGQQNHHKNGSPQMRKTTLTKRIICSVMSNMQFLYQKSIIKSVKKSMTKIYIWIKAVTENMYLGVRRLIRYVSLSMLFFYNFPAAQILLQTFLRKFFGWIITVPFAPSLSMGFCVAVISTMVSIIAFSLPSSRSLSALLIRGSWFATYGVCPPPVENPSPFLLLSDVLRPLFSGKSDCDGLPSPIELMSSGIVSVAYLRGIPWPYQHIDLKSEISYLLKISNFLFLI